MKIILTKGTGSGETILSAFDAALYNAGVANHNLILLSSIIPVGSEVIEKKIDINEHELGNKLYIVLARKDQLTTGKSAWAGIGWQQRDDGAGIFVEHSGDSEDEIRALIAASLTDETKRREGSYGKINIITSSIQCQKTPVCAIVSAVYKSENW